MRTREIGRRQGASAARGAALGALALACCADDLFAQAPQATFSIGRRSNATGALSSQPLVPLTQGDVLRAFPLPGFGPLPRPAIVFTGGQLGLSLYTTCLGQTAQDGCPIEVDALSLGNDARFQNPPGAALAQSARLYFSVDEFARGIPGTPAPPAVWSESFAGPAAREASADVFAALDLPAGPLPPGPVIGNTGTLDGNGLASATGVTYRGLGLVEPNVAGALADGDDLDALHLAPPGPTQLVYFSLDAGFVDPQTGQPNTNSAQANGFLPAMVLRKNPGIGGSPSVYALPLQLGLDRFGPGTDDLDALALAENGDGVFQPSQVPYDWGPDPAPGLGANPTDMLLFSVRRGSAVVGQPDSIFGLPIEPGDVLVPPVAGGNGNPGILYAAETFGVSTQRSNGFRDEVDAIAILEPSAFDCNENGVEDSVDIANGFSIDANENGVPDECEPSGDTFCSCAAPGGPCGNHDPSAGCANSTGVGASLASSGSSSVYADDLVLSVTQLPLDKTGLFLMAGAETSVPLGDGLRCLGGTLYRFGVFNSGSTGSGSKGPGIAAESCLVLPSAACITIGSTWRFQVWYRDPAGPCGTFTNVSDGVRVTFTD